MNAMRMNGRMFDMPPVVMNLLIINAIVFLAYSVLGDGVRYWMTENLALFYPASPFFKPFQIVTHMFMHGDFLHLFTNMFALWMFGRIVEPSIGSKRFLAFYFITGIGAALLHMGVTALELGPLAAKVQEGAVTAQDYWLRVNTPMVGASGAIFGILTAFGMLFPNSIIMLMLPPVRMKAKYFVMLYAVLELLFGVTGTLSNIAHFAHLGGALFGFLLMWYWKKKGKLYY